MGYGFYIPAIGGYFERICMGQDYVWDIANNFLCQLFD